MSVVVVTGSAGLIGSETARHFAARGLDVVGIDNNLREHFFGAGRFHPDGAVTASSGTSARPTATPISTSATPRVSTGW